MKPADPQVNLPKMEEEILEFWKKNDIFQKSNKRRKNAKEFAFYDGPPFANGLPHYGHLLANTIKDVVPRYWNMKGYFVERRFGWDTHGVPVEFEIEKRENIKGRQDILDIGVATFNEMCRESVLSYTNEWQSTVTRLGRWVDWDHQYKTMDPSFMESVWWVFKTLFDRGLVYKGHKVVPYSPRITAVLSNFEANQNYQEVQDPAITVKFKLVDEDASLLAWTTTPWTLISNLALAVGPDVAYVKVQMKDTGEVYYIAEDRCREVLNLSGSKKKDRKAEVDFEVLARLKGSDLVGKKYLPLFNYFKNHANAFQVLSGDFVTTSEGTGIVHLAPAYGEDDFRVCSQASIDLVDPLDEEGRYQPYIAEYAGLFVKDADKQIIKDLKAEGLLFKHETLVHSYPMCERTGEPLIYRAVPSWYVAVEKIKDQLVENNKKVHWVPGHLKEGRMGKWLENARDWAISRNRFWGTPIPVWVCDKHEDHISVIGEISTLQELTGAQITDIHKHHIDHLTFACEKCEGTMKRISEVFDCWFESGSMPYAQLHYPFENKERFEKIFPADFIAEGLDQTRGWFYTLSVLSAALFQKPAFRNVVVNGLVLAEDGRKMSKRWKNYTPPDDLMGEFGADSVRLYMLNSAILRGEDLRFSNEGVKDTIRAVILPLWNAYSFLSTYAAADNWQPSAELAGGQSPQVSSELDRWLISRYQSVVRDVHAEMENYQLYRVVPKLVNFIGDLTNWYIRLSRRKFWVGDDAMSEETRQAYETLFYVLCGFSKLFAPFAPFTAEKIYRGLTDGLQAVAESAHLCDAPVFDESLSDDRLESQMGIIRTIAELGRSLRAKHQLKTRQALPAILVISRNKKHKDFINQGMELIKSELNIKEVEFTTEETQYVNLSLKPNLPVLGKRLGKNLRDLRAELAKLNENPDLTAQFIADLEEKGSAKLANFDFSAGDFLIERSPKDSRLIATENGVTVLLDTKLTPDLIKEGIAREIINRIQNFRKDSDLKVTDKIYLAIECTSDLSDAVKIHEDYIASETLATTIKLGVIEKDDVGKSFLTEGKLGDETYKIAMRV